MKLFGSKRSSKPPQADPRLTRALPFQSVEIQFGEMACAAAKAMAGERRLCAKAPIIPLSNCDHPARCDCRYARFPDRRDGPRRKSDGALPSNQGAVQLEEQRHDQGRRAEELGPGGRPQSWFRDGRR